MTEVRAEPAILSGYRIDQIPMTGVVVLILATSHDARTYFLDPDEARLIGRHLLKVAGKEEGPADV